MKVDQEKSDTFKKHKGLGDKSSHVQKEDLAKESIECVENNVTETCADSNPLLGFVDSTNLKTIVDGEIGIDTSHPDDIGAKGNEILSVSTEERSKKAIHEVFGSNSSNSANSEQQRKHYPDMRSVGLWSDATTKSNDIVAYHNLNPKVAHDMEVLRPNVWKGNASTNTGPRVYTNEEEIAAAVNYMRNRSATTKEPFTKVVSKATKKNLKKGFHVHNTRSRGKLPD